MSIQHHPPYELLMRFASGTLDLGQHVGIATHLVGCAHCREAIHMLEHVGGTLLTEMPPAQMSADAFEKVEARLPQAKPVESVAAMQIAPRPEFQMADKLPAFARAYPIGPWQWLAPRMSLARIVLPEPSETRVFLLKSGPGTRLVQHTHSGSEITCVLQGAFSHDGHRYEKGDFDFGDATMDHDVFVEPGEDCICLIAMQGELRLKGLIGRLLQPFVRM